VRLTDFMPVWKRSASRRGHDIDSRRQILRLVEGLAGEVNLELHFRPTFDYAGTETAVTASSGGAVARAGHESLMLTCPFDLQAERSGGVVASGSVSAGDRIWFGAAYEPRDFDSRTLEMRDAEAYLLETVQYWQDWSGHCTYYGPYQEMVRRSALTLKLLTFEPSGAIVAAPTTSLPEDVGGVRNWDYRYAWLRDSSLILTSLMGVGYHDEAIDFFDWLESLCIGCHSDIQIMYRIEGQRELPELTLDHLEGYRGSRPVRIGNTAASQRQIDVYGEVLDATHVCFERMPRPMDSKLWTILRHLADRAAADWREPDQGIWEVRSAPRHFLYSKLLCWVALDRAVKLAKRASLEGDINRWRETRKAIRQAILVDGFDSDVGAFTGAFGDKALDASALVIPLVGFLPATDPRVRSTVERIRERLTSQGLVYRYLKDDGLTGGEATFALCSFWLVDNLALGGNVDEARALFERIVCYANDLGLFAEEIEPGSGELLGNFPQGFTHLALIRSALNIVRAETRGADDVPQTPAQRAGDTGRL
jgi:GH15 family glucan-1,4-alpha-glucosidase